MKRFASHYLYIPSHGFLRQYVTGIDEKGHVVSLYPLKEEVESIIWTPGVIKLIPQHFTEFNAASKERTLKEECMNEVITFNQLEKKQNLPAEYDDIVRSEFVAIRLYPFDFATMKVTTDTVIQILDNHIF